MEQDQDDKAGNQGNSRRDRLRRKIEHFQQVQQARHLQRAQFGERGFLRPQVIELFEQEPMNGVDIMNKLQEMSRGWYRPSPGSIYPLLEQLEIEGMITKNKDGKFELTKEFAKRSGVSDDVANALSALESNASYLEELGASDAAKLAKGKERIAKMAKRLSDLNQSLESRGTSQ